ncbi:MAG: 1-phosphofructokinase family hexose kinase [Candidatus Brocadiia bacterium]
MIITVTPNPAFDKTLQVNGFEIGEHLRAKVLGCIPAGKGINVSRGLFRLGRDSTAGALIGRNDRAGFESVLRHENIQPLLVSVDGVTRTNTTIMDTVSSTTTHIREEGPEVSTQEFAELAGRLERTIAAAHKSVRIVITGSLPPGVEKGPFTELLKACGEAGARIYCDTSGRPFRWAVESGRVDVVTPNVKELGEYLGNDIDTSQVPEAASTLFPAVSRVIVTGGKRGAWVVDDDRVIHAAADLPEEKVRNTVGCGDAFLAGWLAARSREMGREKSLRWAVAAGTACAMGESAVDYERSRVETILRRV